MTSRCTVSPFMATVGLPLRPSWLTGALPAQACLCKLPLTKTCNASQGFVSSPFLTSKNFAPCDFQASFLAYTHFTSRPRFQACTIRHIVILLEVGQLTLYGDAVMWDAHRRFGSTYKWLLYGDDDTFFFTDAVLSVLGRLDPEMPYFLTGVLHT